MQKSMEALQHLRVLKVENIMNKYIITYIAWGISQIAHWTCVGFIFYIAYLMGKNNIDYYGWVIFLGFLIATLGGYNLKLQMKSDESKEEDKSKKE